MHLQCIYSALDIVVGDVVGLGLGDQFAQFAVVVGIAAALADGNGHFLADLGKDLCFRGVGLFLFTLDIIPFAMS